MEHTGFYESSFFNQGVHNTKGGYSTVSVAANAKADRITVTINRGSKTGEKMTLDLLEMHAVVEGMEHIKSVFERV